MRGKDQTERDRGVGPFTGRQLTIVIVAICAAIVVGAPVTALAAAGAFTNNSATVPAVQATNSNAHGIGVQGTGKKFGVYSNGPLGVAAGKSLSCTGCVAPTALSTAAKAIQPLAHGQSESGVIVAGAEPNSASAYRVYAGTNFAQPIPGGVTAVDAAAHPTECPGPGLATAGYMCIYVSSYYSPTASFAGEVVSSDDGLGTVWDLTANDSGFQATYTATEP
jgi:hypothetical protein